MIQLIDNLPDGTLGFSCSGLISGEDMQRQVIPTVEAALREQERVKALVVFDPAFTGFNLEAAWDDTNLALAIGMALSAWLWSLIWPGYGRPAAPWPCCCPTRCSCLAWMSRRTPDVG